MKRLIFLFLLVGLIASLSGEAYAAQVQCVLTATQISPPEITTVNNIEQRIYTTSLSVITQDGWLSDTACIFPPYSGLNSASWEKKTSGIDIKGYRNVKGFVCISDTSDADSILYEGDADTISFAWQTSVDGSTWESLDASSLFDTLLVGPYTPSAGANYSELKPLGMNFAGHTSLGTGVGTKLRVHAVIDKMANPTSADTCSIKFKLILLLEK